MTAVERALSRLLGSLDRRSNSVPTEVLLRLDDYREAKKRARARLLKEKRDWEREAAYDMWLEGEAHGRDDEGADIGEARNGMDWG